MSTPISTLAEDDNSTEEREALKVMSLEYRMERRGHVVPEPIVTMFCQTGDGDRRTVEVTGHYPYLYITEDEFEARQDEILKMNRVRRIEARDAVVSDEHEMNTMIDRLHEPPRETLGGENLVRIYTIEPENVGEIRDEFDDHYEADVFFTNRFLVDTGIYTGVEVPAGEDRVDVSEIEPLGDETPDVHPRILAIDIEVWSGNGFPSTDHVQQPITCATMYDNYEDEYATMVLEPDEDTWSGEQQWELPEGVDTSQIEIETFENEVDLLEAANEWIIDHDPDLLTGWNSSSNDIGSGFDYPYWINRCYEKNAWSVEDLSETGDVFVTNRGSAVVKGRQMFDMMQAYKKTQIHEKRSYALDAIAEDELGYGKEDIDDLDEGWLHDPETFVKYNIRDTQAVVDIERSKKVLDMYDHIRSIAGADYTEIADSNIGLIDMLYLRRAGERGIALPSSERPEVQHYWGAYVFPPEAGLHENVVYPDLSSLYPNLFRDMNASTETIVGFEEDLAESEYTKDDCHTVYVDTRDESTKRSVDEPKRTELYVLKPEVRESFVREIVQELIDMKYEYKSDEYSDEAYEAVKRITNSVYGVMGDSTTYGVGFRLFDWRIAEAITLAGRDVIKHTADEFQNYVDSRGYDDSRIIAGDTDSCVCTIPSADTRDEVLDVSVDGAEYVNGTFEDFMRGRFNIEDGNMEVEIESYAETALFMDKKKRYAQWITWDEGEDVDEVEFKGFESVRSDSSKFTEDVQETVIEMILKDDDRKESITQYLSSKRDALLDGDVPDDDIGIPSKINEDLWSYGWSEQDDGSINYYTPQPHIRGARYANEYFDGEQIGSGDKPLMYYVERVSGAGDLSVTYDYENELTAPEDDPEMKEANRTVDAVSVNDVSNLPDEVQIDYEKMSQRILESPVRPIIDVMGWQWDEVTGQGMQSGLGAYM